jgi:hypothetical protein
MATKNLFDGRVDPDQLDLLRFAGFPARRLLPLLERLLDRRRHPGGRFNEQVETIIYRQSKIRVQFAFKCAIHGILEKIKQKFCQKMSDKLLPENFNYI